MDIPVWFTIVGLFLFLSYFSNVDGKQKEPENNSEELSDDDFDDYEDGVDYV